VAEDRYIVFDVETAQRTRRGPAGARARAPFRVERLSRSAADDAKHDPKVVVARPIPTKLVKPVAKRAVPKRGTTGTAWGVLAVGAPKSPFTGKGIKVAILDTGIDAGHPAFKGVKITQRDFTGEGDGDQQGHGTHVAGTIGGQDVGGFRIGVARSVELLIGKVLDHEGSGSTAGIFEGILWAIKEGAHVISMSLGIDFPGIAKELQQGGMAIEPATSLALEEYRETIRLFGALSQVIASERFGRPSLIVAATGNESDRGTGAHAYTIGIAPPAASDGYLGVAAIQWKANKTSIAPFSNTGPAVAGPGVDVISAKLGGGLVSFDGTSMATPHAAGVAALWAEKLAKTDGDVDTDVLRARLTGTAKAIAGLKPVDVGAGLVQAPAS